MAVTIRPNFVAPSGHMMHCLNVPTTSTATDGGRHNFTEQSPNTADAYYTINAQWSYNGPWAIVESKLDGLLPKAVYSQLTINNFALQYVFFDNNSKSTGHPWASAYPPTYNPDTGVLSWRWGNYGHQISFLRVRVFYEGPIISSPRLIF